MVSVHGTVLTTARFPREEEGYSLLLYYSVPFYYSFEVDTTIASSMGPEKFQGFPELLRPIPAKLLNCLNDLFQEELPLHFLPELVTRRKKRGCNRNVGK